MCRSLAFALLAVVMLAGLAPALSACTGYPGVEHNESAALPNPI